MFNEAQPYGDFECLKCGLAQPELLITLKRSTAAFFKSELDIKDKNRFENFSVPIITKF